MPESLKAMGHDTVEIRKRIRKGMFMLFEVAQAIEKLPESELRIELEAKHEAILTKISELEDVISGIDSSMCWFGMAPSCPGCPCGDCPYLEKITKMNHIPTVEEFDAQRIANAKKYYQEKKDAERLEF